MRYGSGLSNGTAFDTLTKNYLFTHNLPQSLAPAGVEYVNEPIKASAVANCFKVW